MRQPSERPILRFARSAAALVAASLTSGCTVMDVHPSHERAEVHSHGLIDGFASFGFADDPSFLKVEVLDGRSDGALAMVDLWYIARVEIGMAGASVGVGPFDFGIGTLFYEPRSPARPWTWDDDDDDDDHDDKEKVSVKVDVETGLASDA